MDLLAMLAETTLLLELLIAADYLACVRMDLSVSVHMLG